jgi:3-oxoacyl-[acyl-carrier protein] reductase
MGLKLAGKTALVTGASSGIGRGIAEGYAAAGAAVGVNHPPVDEERAAATEVVDTVRKDGGEATRFQADVSEVADVAEMVDAFEDVYGSPDILVNNAGVIAKSRLTETSVETWDRILSVNLRGVFLTTRFALPGMLDGDGETVINVASQLAFSGAAQFVPYVTSKAGVVGFTRALAREVAPDLRVNAIAPGPIDTGFVGDDADKSDSLPPLGREGNVENVVPTAVFLASDDAAYYTGQTLSPDGGDAMH